MVCSASNLFLAVKDTIKVYDQDFVLVRQAKLETVFVS